MTIVIVSGGLDSTVLYYKLGRNASVRGIHFLYGARHEAAETAALRRVIPSVVDFKIPFHFDVTSSLLANGPLPSGRYTEESLRSTVVPFRNGVMLSYAAAIAESQGAEALAYGAHHDDDAVYPDCRPEFIEAMCKAINTGTLRGVYLLAPFSHMTKAEIVQAGHDLGLDSIMAQTWSCYAGGEVHCGQCSTCHARKLAFKEAGVRDKTKYAH